MKDILDSWRCGLMVSDQPDEYEVKQLLSKIGLRIPQGIRLAPERIDIVPDFPGPYVAKICAPEIVHKTDLSGVFLNLTAETLFTAVSTLNTAFPAKAILVEEMISFEGPELIAGGVVDPSFGPAVMVGAGGILTEITQDVTFRLAPCSAAEARRMLAELNIYPVFEGFRGLSLEPDTLTNLLVTISQLINVLGTRFDQLDLNPIVWSKGQWVILDAKLMLV